MDRTLACAASTTLLSRIASMNHFPVGRGVPEQGATGTKQSKNIQHRTGRNAMPHRESEVGSSMFLARARRRPRPRSQAIRSRRRTSTTRRRKGWFMESPLSFFRMHWDHEPVRGERHLFGVPPSGGSDRLKPGLRTVGSWRAPFRFFALGP